MEVEMEPFYVSPHDDMSVSIGDDRSTRSDDASIASDRSTSTVNRRQSDRRSHRHRRPEGQIPAASINYHGINIAQAAGQGNLPVCVLLWGMATAKRVNLMDPDSQGNTPMHFAALAELPEVMGFLQQQGRSRSNNDNRLVDSRNEMGETPLLRAASVGKIPVLKYLLDEGSDPFCIDRFGNNIFIILARYSHIWGLHYVYSTLCEKFGQGCIYELLCATDGENNTALDWAAAAGDVNVIEYLLRRGLDPTLINNTGRTALHLAVKSNRLNAARFLVKCGCDPLQKDNENESPVTIAIALQNRELLKALRRRVRRESTCINKCLSCMYCMVRKRNIGDNGDNSALANEGSDLVGIPGGSREINQNHNQNHQFHHQNPNHRVNELEIRTARLNSLLGTSMSNDFKDKDCHDDMLSQAVISYDHTAVGISLYTKNSQGERTSHALHRLKPPRFIYAFLYSLIILGYMILTVCVPFYIWLLLLLLSFVTFRRALNIAQAAESLALQKQPPRSGSMNYFMEFILAPEKFLGFYMGIVLACVLFWFCSLRIGILADFISSADIGGNGSDYLYREGSTPNNSMIPFLNSKFFTIGGLSSSTDDYNLFCANVAGLLVSATLWGHLVWFSTDPGAVSTRDRDFDVILDLCLGSHGPASDQLYCRTTFVKKPIRSKYCTQTGLVIARMDHYCVWLGNSVGFKNHRIFILFLITQLAATSMYSAMLVRALKREMFAYSSACGAVSHLLDMRYFYATSLCALLIIISVIIAALLAEQSMNIAMNITTNERLNRSRYPWMCDSLGLPFNHYDRGILKNILEFICFPGFEKDYFSEFNWLSLRDESLKASAAVMSTSAKIEKSKGNDRPDSLRNHINGIQQNSHQSSHQNIYQNTSHSTSNGNFGSNENGEASPALQHPSVHNSNLYGSPFREHSPAFREYSSSDQSQSFQTQSASTSRFKLLPARPNLNQSSCPNHMGTHTQAAPQSQSLSPSMSQTDLVQSPQLLGLPHGHVHYTVLTRAQEAQMQFEMRVQHAIDMSKLPSDAHAVRTSRGMGQSDQLAQHSGYAPYIEADKHPSGNLSDWNMYAKTMSSSQRDVTYIHEGLQGNESRSATGGGYLGPTSLGPTAVHTASPQRTGAALHHDIIPSPKIFRESPHTISVSGCEGVGESNVGSGWQPGGTMTVPYMEKRTLNTGHSFPSYPNNINQSQPSPRSPDRSTTPRVYK